jgi:hypothetical protein
MTEDRRHLRHSSGARESTIASPLRVKFRRTLGEAAANSGFRAINARISKDEIIPASARVPHSFESIENEVESELELTLVRATRIFEVKLDVFEEVGILISGELP